MLVISRKLGESIILRDANGNDCRVVLVDIRGDKIRLGVEAPDSTDIIRHELLSRWRGEAGPKHRRTA